MTPILRPARPAGGASRSRQNARACPKTPGPDRRIERTRDALWLALLDLMRECDWGDIGVQALCDRANVGRSTFYAHFPTKQALLDWGFARDGAAIRAQVVAASATIGEGRLATVEWLVSHMTGAKGFLRRLTASPSGYIIQDRFRRTLRDVLGAELALRGLKVAPLRLTFQTGGLFAALEEAAAQGLPPETMILRLSAEILGTP